MFAHEEKIPFLVNFAVTRGDAPSIGGCYSEHQDMWVDENTGIPMIELGNLMEVSTKTNTVQEADDQMPYSNEVQTKTFAQTESDDNDIHYMSLAELMTKTAVQLESDDNGPDF
ncbi:hypothetical protein [Vibrio sp. SCSIO 43169]|uniref:hypothetical protein n=1 Tax=Vibrio sp. SCSIO 43169 TaxID=2822801 RepID=UPI002044A122|nr:hypothetical protein [Vibrio sp. SCSIO 43169]MCM5507147.1 hypothetical protein [Vibrio sp. SCSIO 43169]